MSTESTSAGHDGSLVKIAECEQWCAEYDDPDTTIPDLAARHSRPKGTIIFHIRGECRHIRERDDSQTARQHSPAEIRASVREITDGERPPTVKEMRAEGIVRPETARRVLGVETWAAVVRDAGLHTRADAVGATLARAARSDRTWVSAAQIKRWHAPEWLPAQEIGRALLDLAEGEAAVIGGIDAEPWSDANRPRWRIWEVDR